MKTVGSDISQLIKQTYKNLEELNKSIQKGAHTIEIDNIETILNNLNKQSSEFARVLSHTTKIEKQFKIEDKLENDLHKLIKTLLHSGAFSQALGPLQDELRKHLTKIESCIKKWQSKVEKSDFDAL